MTTTAQATLDLASAPGGGVAGSMRPAAGAAVTLLGVAEARAGTERLLNLSVRSLTAPTVPLIAGFVVAGTTAKQLLLRAAGPALVPALFKVPNAVAIPRSSSCAPAPSSRKTTIGARPPPTPPHSPPQPRAPGLFPSAPAAPMPRS